MREFTVEDYIEALECVGPKANEHILARAFPDFVRLCKVAYPEQV